MTKAASKTTKQSSTKGAAACPVLPLVSTIGALWDAVEAAQIFESNTGGDSTNSDQIESLRISAEEIASSSRAGSLAGVLFRLGEEYAAIRPVVELYQLELS